MSLVILIATSMTVMFHLMHFNGTITITQLADTLIELAFVINIYELLAHFTEKS